MKLHHIGIVVNKIQESLGEFEKYLNFQSISLPTPVGSQKVNVCFLKVGEPFLELIEPVSPDSPIAEYAVNGGGIHHLCFEVKDIHKEKGRSLSAPSQVCWRYLVHLALLIVRVFVSLEHRPLDLHFNLPT